MLLSPARFSLFPTLFGGLALLDVASAASLTNLTSGGTLQPTNINVSDLGTTNWAVWDVRSGDPVPSVSPYATRTGGLGTISAITFSGSSTNVRGTDVLTSYPNVFTWTGGTTAPTSDGKLTGVFGGNVNNFNNGVSLSISNLAPLALGETYQISVLGAPFNGRGTVTASATGATDVTQLSLESLNGNVRQTNLFQFSYTPELITDTLDLSFRLTTDGVGSSSHVTIQGIGISIIPEPSSATLLIGAAAGLLLRRRRI